MTEKERFEKIIGKIKGISTPLTLDEDGEYYSLSTFDAFRIFKAVTYSAQCEIAELKKTWHTDYIEKVSQINQLKADLKNAKDDMTYFRNQLSELRENLEKVYCGSEIELAYGSTSCGKDFHGTIMQCDKCKAL